jgi:hypothetical protein
VENEPRYFSFICISFLRAQSAKTKYERIKSTMLPQAELQLVR